MKEYKNDRRSFLKNSSAAAGLMALPFLQNSNLGHFKTEIVKSAANPVFDSPRIKFSVIGMNHAHIYGQVEAVKKGGGQLVSYFAKEEKLIAEFAKRYPDAKLAKDEKEILEDKSIQLVLSSAIASERAPLGIRVMKSGKDFMSDKPGITTFEQLAEVRKVQKATGQIYSIMYSERFENKATVKAGELVKAGAIGKVIQTVGFGPHRMNTKSRPEWFFDKDLFGGIITDIASHQFDQYLYFTGSTKAEVVASQIGNVHHPEFPKFEDFGDAMMRGNGGMGYIRVDWFTPDGLKTWGDGRLTILGTDGYIEIRKNIDIASEKKGGSHLFLVDGKDTTYFDCSAQVLPYGVQLVDDILNRTETAMTQEHCFLAMELALKAQKNAQRIDLNL